MGPLREKIFRPAFSGHFSSPLVQSTVLQFSTVLITTITRQKQRCLETLDSSPVPILVSFSGFAHGTHSISSFFLSYSAYFPSLPSRPPPWPNFQRGKESRRRRRGKEVSVRDFFFEEKESETYNARDVRLAHACRELRTNYKVRWKSG